MCVCESMCMGFVTPGSGLLLPSYHSFFSSSFFVCLASLLLHRTYIHSNTHLHVIIHLHLHFSSIKPPQIPRPLPSPAPQPHNPTSIEPEKLYKIHNTQDRLIIHVCMYVSLIHPPSPSPNTPPISHLPSPIPSKQTTHPANPT